MCRCKCGSKCAEKFYLYFYLKIIKTTGPVDLEDLISLSSIVGVKSQSVSGMEYQCDSQWVPIYPPFEYVVLTS